MTTLSANSIRKRILSTNLDEAAKLCDEGKIDSLGEYIGIFPFREENLGTFTYDLSIGAEAYSLRKALKFKVGADSPLSVEPGETVLVLTEEYLILSPLFAGLCISRARIMDEGMAQSVAKIDPTWYGKLIVALTNQTKRKIELDYQEPFCTVVFTELDQPIERPQFLKKRDLPFLGQTTLNYKSKHAVLWEPVPKEKVSEKDADSLVQTFGSPFDVVRGLVHFNKEEIIKYMEQQWGPNALREMKYAIWEEELRYLKNSARANTIALILAIVGWLGAIVGIFLTLHGKK